MQNNKEVLAIIHNLQNVWNGEPWFGKPVKEILTSLPENIVFNKPNNASHSAIELVYHLHAWASFCLHRVAKNADEGLITTDAANWPAANPGPHVWQEAIEALEKVQQDLITLLATKEDSFLDETVAFRKYNFRFLLNGLAQHNIYHAGQIAYLQKL
jgi:uncharacterized damage-inducible protein DinB